MLVYWYRTICRPIPSWYPWSIRLICTCRFDVKRPESLCSWTVVNVPWEVGRCSLSAASQWCSQQESWRIRPEANSKHTQFQKPETWDKFMFVSLKNPYKIFNWLVLKNSLILQAEEQPTLCQNNSLIPSRKYHELHAFYLVVPTCCWYLILQYIWEDHKKISEVCKNYRFPGMGKKMAK